MSYSPTAGTHTIGDFSASRDNNFNLLRFLAASGVILSHSIILSGQVNNGMAWALGYISVNCFFIISGFLVSASILNRGSIQRYTRARMLRIYPALLVCIVLCILSVGVLSSDKNILAFLISPQTLEFWLKNSLLVVGEVQITLPTDLFADNPVPHQVNAPLWTLQYELLMYALLGIIYIVSRASKPAAQTTIFLVLASCIGGICMIIFLVNITQEQPFRGAAANIVRFAAMFFYGSVLFLLRDKIRLYHGAFFGICFLILLSLMRRELFVCVTYLSLGYMLVYLAYIPGGTVRAFNRLGDYSYGLYIYAFPIQQILMHFYPATSAFELLILTFAITLVAAVASWHLVEQKALAQKR